MQHNLAVQVAARLCSVARLHAVDRIGHLDNQRSVVVPVIVILSSWEPLKFQVHLSLHAACYDARQNVARGIHARRAATTHAAHEAIDALDNAVNTFYTSSTAHEALVTTIVFELPLHLEVLACAEDCANGTV